MASIPLPALNVRPPEPVDPTGGVVKALQLKDLMNRNAMMPGQLKAQQQQLEAGAQENQMRQLQLDERKTLMDTSKGIDWTQPDAFNKFISSAQQSGKVSPQTLSQMALQRAQYTEAASKATIEQRKAQAEINNAILGSFDAISTEKDPAKRAQLAQAQAAKIVGQGLQAHDPKLDSVIQAMAQGKYVPDDDALQMLTAGLKDHNTVISEAQKAAQTREAAARAGEAEANTEKIKKENELGTGPMADSRYRFIQQQKQLGHPVSAEESAFLKAYEKQKTLVPVANFNLQNAGATGTGAQPSAMAKAVADGSMKWGDVISARTPASVKNAFLAEVKQINPNFNSGDFSIAQDVKKSFTSGDYSKKLNSIATAREHMKVFTSLGEKLDNGDVQSLSKLKNAIGVEFGSDNVTNFNIAKQFFAGEVGQAVVAGQGTEGERNQLANDISNASSWAQLKGALSTADKLLAGKQVALKQTFDQGVKAKPNLGEEGGDGGWGSKFGGKPH
jgi:hypothetical protein